MLIVVTYLDLRILDRALGQPGTNTPLSSLNSMESTPSLADWTEDRVWSYVRANRIPYNALYDHGYTSIGCAPCTRPTAPGEDPRAGRWWWEGAAPKECGMHCRIDWNSL